MLDKSNAHELTQIAKEAGALVLRATLKVAVPLALAVHSVAGQPALRIKSPEASVFSASSTTIRR